MPTCSSLFRSFRCFQLGSGRPSGAANTRGWLGRKASKRPRPGASWKRGTEARILLRSLPSPGLWQHFSERSRASFARRCRPRSLTAGPRPRESRGASAGRRRAPARRSRRVVLLVALLVLVLYAAFDHGAVGVAAERADRGGGRGDRGRRGRRAWLWTGTLRLAAPARARSSGSGCWRRSRAGAAISVALERRARPDLDRAQPRDHLRARARPRDRRSAPRTRARSSCSPQGFLADRAGRRRSYALGQKLFPGLHVAGVFDLNQTGPLPAAPGAARLLERAGAVHRDGGPDRAGARRSTRRGAERRRLAALLARRAAAADDRVHVLARGLLALVVALAVGDRVRAPAASLACCGWRSRLLGAVPALVFGLARSQPQRRRRRARRARACRAELAAVLLVIAGSSAGRGRPRG